MARNVATIEEESQAGDYFDPAEMSTNKLASGTLSRPRPAFGSDDWDMVPDADWLLRLTGTLRTADLDEEPAFVRERQSRFASAHAGGSGMSAHRTAAKIVPTRGARFTTGLKRLTLLTLLSALGIGTVVGAGYLLTETAWLSNLYAPAPPEPVEQPVQPPPQIEVAPPAPVTLPPIRDSRPPAQAALPESTNPTIPADMEESVLAGTDALDLRERGIEAYKAGDYPLAVTLLEQSVALNKDDAVAQYQLGMAYMSITGREHALEDAELAFRTAASLQPGWAGAHQMLAESFIRRDFFVEAIQPAQQATKLDPTMAEAWLTLGRAYNGAGMTAEAELAFAEAARYSPRP